MNYASYYWAEVDEDNLLHVRQDGESHGEPMRVKCGKTRMWGSGGAGRGPIHKFATYPIPSNACRACLTWLADADFLGACAVAVWEETNG